MGRVAPCTGIREKDVLGYDRGFGSVVTRAVRTKYLEDTPDVEALGLLGGFGNGGVPATLHVVDHEHVLWYSLYLRRRPRVDILDKYGRRRVGSL